MWFDEYNAEDLKPKILRFQEYLIDLGKEYIEEIDQTPVVAKFVMDERVRVAHIFVKLDQWVKKMRSLVLATLGERYRKPLYILHKHHTRRLVIHFYYYQHILRSHIDITYTIEFLIHIHEAFSSRMKRNWAETVTSAAEAEKAVNETIQLYDKYKDQNVTEDTANYYAMMIQAGLKPTLPPPS